MKLVENYLVSKIPVLLRQHIGQLPDKVYYLLTHSYINEKNEIKAFENLDLLHQQRFVYDNIKRNIEHAYLKIPFYRDFYDKNNFKPTDLKSFNDIKRIPIINKSILLEYPLAQRSYHMINSVKVNTGGSSGHTLDFFKDKITRLNHEKTHMDTIWEKLGYKKSDLKLVMVGANTVQDGVDFCFRTNSLRLDTYNEFSKNARKLYYLSEKYPIKYLHGYPSIVYEFAVYCEEHDQILREILRKSLKGAFLGSEYPHPHFRDKIEQVFDIETVSWYGHTEGALLAWEKDEKFRYYPFLTYGFAEVSDEGHLLATTYYNNASPFIRYDTEDTVSEAEMRDGFLISFNLYEGRSGEYIKDSNEKKISLTALIFGRHHRLFDYCSYIQICQKFSGEAVVLYVPKEENLKFNPSPYFDSSNLHMKFTFRKLNNPVRTRSGKINLLVKAEDLGV